MSGIVICQGLIQALLTLAVYLMSLWMVIPQLNSCNDENEHIKISRSQAFVVLTVLQLNQAFLSRSVTLSAFKTGITGNKWMIAANIFSFIALIFAIYIPRKIMLPLFLCCCFLKKKGF